MRRIWLLGLVLTLLGMFTVIGTINAQAPNPVATDSVASVDLSNQESTSDKLINRVKRSWPWYLTRASGLVAAGSLVFLMLSGVGMITGKTFSFFEPITAWATHRALGIAFGVSVFVHIFALYFDRFVPFGIATLLIPFYSEYRPISVFGINIGSFYVATGVVSLYLVAAIILTSLLWVQKHPNIWKLTHLFSYLAMILVFIHALFLGTDLSQGLFRWVWIIIGFSILTASLFRLWRANTV